MKKEEQSKDQKVDEIRPNNLIVEDVAVQDNKDKLKNDEVQISEKISTPTNVVPEQQMDTTEHLGKMSDKFKILGSLYEKDQGCNYDVLMQFTATD